MTTLPEGCSLDGIAQRDHAVRWSSSAGWHGWVAPEREQIQGRVRDMREAAAAERYQAALERGLSDYEAREEGWPS